MRDYRHSTLDWTCLRPPPYLLGTTLLVWGAFTDQNFLGIACACLLEGHQKIQRRFDFSNQDYVRLWNFCVALFLMVAVFQVVGQEVGRWHITRSFQKWMPMLLFPMALAQYYSKDSGIPVTTFSIVARRKRLLDERAGRRVAQAKRAHLGFFYFGVLLLSIGLVGKEAPRLGQLLGIHQGSGLGKLSSLYIIAGALITWALSVFIPISRRGFAIALIALAMALGYQLQLGVRELHHYVEAKATQWITGRSGGDPSRTTTSFGEIGELKLSPKIFWRVTHLEGDRPTLLPEATYNVYNRREWRSMAHRSQSKPLTANDDDRTQWELYALGIEDTTSVIEIRGRAAPTQLLPRLEDAALFEDLPAANVDLNALGTVIAEPRYSAIRYTVNAGPTRPGLLESLPRPSRDLELPAREEPVLRRVVEREFGSLPEKPRAREVIRAVEAWFLHPDNRFQYSKFLKGTGDYFAKANMGPVGHFLETSRSGHCEYYATATVLLLRQLGIPARYTVGYALSEIDPKTNDYLLRGVHRHAWARVWVQEEQRWVDVDTTPADWIGVEKRDMTTLQRFVERWEQWMLAWNLWRRDDSKGLLWSVLPLLLAGALLIVVVLRLIRGLRKSQASSNDSEDDQKEPLALLGMDSAWFELETLLSERVKKRGDSQTVGNWCRDLTWLRPDLRTELPELMASHYQYRFDPQGLNEAALTSFRNRVTKIIERLQQDREATSAP